MKVIPIILLSFASGASFASAMWIEIVHGVGFAGQVIVGVICLALAFVNAGFVIYDIEKKKPRQSLKGESNSTGVR